MSISTTASGGPRLRYAWARSGDVNAFFGLMIDNISGLILMTSLLVSFGVPRDFVLTRMIPGTAVGVLVGDLIYTAMAFRLARKTGRTDVTAMPLGLDTPSTIASVILVIIPSFRAAQGRGMDPSDAAQHAWYIGLTMLLASGVFKLGCATVSGWVRKSVPRAGLLGSLTAIALVIISFMPLGEIAAQPVAGFASLTLVLATMTARWKLPYGIPGALGAVVVGCLIFYAMYLLGLGPGPGSDGYAPESWLRVSLPLPIASWWVWLQQNGAEAVSFLPVAIPLALATVVGGIDCTESAAAAGDDYPTGRIIAVEGFATLVGGLLGGVIQTTPYIGHPAYKAMGARAAYTFATAIFVGAVGIFGYFDWIFYLIPKAVILPILIFIGLEITAQSFHATTHRHYAAVAFSCVPALAYLALITLNRILPETGVAFSALSPPTQQWLVTLSILSSGFIVTSLVWGTFLTHLIDGKAAPAVTTLFLAAVMAWFGIIHSPLPSGRIGTPASVMKEVDEMQRTRATAGQSPYHWAAAYGVAGLVVGFLGLRRLNPRIEDSDFFRTG